MPTVPTEFTMLSDQMEHLVTEHEDRIEHWRAFSANQERRIARLEHCIARARHLAEAQAVLLKDDQLRAHDFHQIATVLGGRLP